MDLKDFDLEHWWNVLAAAGAIIVVAAITARWPAAVFVGLGVLTLGIGESMQRERHTVLRHPEPGIPGMLGTGFRRRPSVVGAAVQVCGAVLLGFGAYRLLTS